MSICRVCKRKISQEEWDSFNGVCGTCDDKMFDAMMEAKELDNSHSQR
jgi:hypothetical protein